MKIIAVIPARYGSSRFAGKPLADLAGAPMIAWVYASIKRSDRIDAVYVATDDPRIAAVCEAGGMDYLMTSADHLTSTERVNEVAQQLDADLFICINGDEPLIDHRQVEKIIPASIPADGLFVANIAAPLSSPAQVMDPTNIKVAFAADGSAQFMSRAPIPYPKGSLDFTYHKHVGVLAYNKAALEFFAATPRAINEVVEDINELRFIEHGVRLAMILVEESEALSVDTPKDLDQVRKIVAERGLQPPGHSKAL